MAAASHPARKGRRSGNPRNAHLFRFLVILVILAAIGGAAVFYLANFVDPQAARDDGAHPRRQAAAEGRGAGRRHRDAAGGGPGTDRIDPGRRGAGGSADAVRRTGGRSGGRASRRSLPRNDERRARRRRRIRSPPIAAISTTTRGFLGESAASASTRPTPDTVRAYLAISTTAALRRARRRGGCRRSASSTSSCSAKGCAPTIRPASVDGPRQPSRLPKVLGEAEVDRLIGAARERRRRGGPVGPGASPGAAPARADRAALRDGPAGVRAGRPAGRGARREAVRFFTIARQGRQRADGAAHRQGARGGRRLSRGAQGGGPRREPLAVSRRSARAAISPGRLSPAI